MEETIVNSKVPEVEIVYECLGGGILTKTFEIDKHLKRIIKVTVKKRVETETVMQEARL